jgi:hypothetical protein
VIIPRARSKGMAALRASGSDDFDFGRDLDGYRVELIERA